MQMGVNVTDEFTGLKGGVADVVCLKGAFTEPLLSRPPLTGLLRAVSTTKTNVNVVHAVIAHYCASSLFIE